MKRIFCIFLLLAGCKDVYNPPLKNAHLNYLVVEGDIIAGTDSTFIYLSRTIPVNDTSIVQPETNARITVEDSLGNSYALQNENNGIYFSAPLNIDPSKNYRLHIFTGDGKEYASDFVPVSISPKIDSVSWNVNANTGLSIYVNTHDPQNATHYYRWDYTETWEHRAKDISQLIYNNGLRPRLPDEQIYRCWNIQNSTSIYLFSTDGLSSDVVYNEPLLTIPYADEKISVVYSMLVTQHTLTQQGYQYWTNLKNNTETLGSLFDPQPFADYGNIHCLTNPAEPVLGFISACSVAKQRIYIKNDDITWPYISPPCIDTIVSHSNIDYFFTQTDFVPLYYGIFNSVHATLPECGDCRQHGGTTIKPSYMP